MSTHLRSLQQRLHHAVWPPLRSPIDLAGGVWPYALRWPAAPWNRLGHFGGPPAQTQPRCGRSALHCRAQSQACAAPRSSPCPLPQWLRSPLAGSRAGRSLVSEVVGELRCDSGCVLPHGTVWATKAARPPNPSHIAADRHFTAAPSRKHVLPPRSRPCPLPQWLRLLLAGSRAGRSLVSEGVGELRCDSGCVLPHGTVWATEAARPPNPSHVAAVRHSTAAPKLVPPQGVVSPYCCSGCARRLPCLASVRQHWSLRG